MKSRNGCSMNISELIMIKLHNAVCLYENDDYSQLIRSGLINDFELIAALYSKNTMDALKSWYDNFIITMPYDSIQIIAYMMTSGLRILLEPRTIQDEQQYIAYRRVIDI